MITHRKSNERGGGDHGWLQSKHSFSFANYYDPEHMGFRSLRVINEDWIEGGKGFDTHPHRDMEIITYVTEGALEHRDSMGNVTIIKPNEIQRMSAGTGVRHSEYNKLVDQRTHLFQIWIEPNQKGGSPGYAQKSFASELLQQEKVLVVSKDGRNGSLAIKQDADLYLCRLKQNIEIHHEVIPGRGLWLQLTSGSVNVKIGDNTLSLKSGDGLSAENESRIEITALTDAEILLFDLL